MENVKNEILEMIENKSAIKCAEILFRNCWDCNVNTHILKTPYSQAEYDAFMESLNFSFMPEYKNQVLFGTIWLEDGSWFVRGKYGPYVWQYNKIPDIPAGLQK